MHHFWMEARRLLEQPSKLNSSWTVRRANTLVTSLPYKARENVVLTMEKSNIDISLMHNGTEVVNVGAFQLTTYVTV